MSLENGAKPKAVMILSGPPAEIEDFLNAHTGDYVMMGGVVFSVVKDELIASCLMVSAAEVRKAQIAQAQPFGMKR